MKASRRLGGFSDSLWRKIYPAWNAGVGNQKAVVKFASEDMWKDLTRFRKENIDASAAAFITKVSSTE